LCSWFHSDNNIQHLHSFTADQNRENFSITKNYERPKQRRRRFELLLDILFDISNISSRRDPSVERFVVFISAAEDLSKVASSDFLFDIF